MDLAVKRIESWVASQEPHYVCVTGAHGVIESLSAPTLRDIHNRSGLTTPDGMPLVWAGRSAGVDGMARVYGPDLTLELCRRGADLGWSIYALGGAPGVASDFAATLAHRFPGLRAAGSCSPPFRPLTDGELLQAAADINDSGADLVFIGLSTPKQEQLMARLEPLLHRAVLLGVGAAFDFHTGRVRQAPGWMQRTGLEWLFRVAIEPRRLWRRYAVIVPRFIVGVLRDRPQLVDSSKS